MVYLIVPIFDNPKQPKTTMLTKITTSSTAVALATISTTTAASSAVSRLRSPENQDKSIVDSRKNLLKPLDVALDIDHEQNGGELMNKTFVENTLKNPVEIVDERPSKQLRRAKQTQQGSNNKLDIGILGSTMEERRQLTACDYPREDITVRVVLRSGCIWSDYFDFILRDASSAVVFPRSQVRGQTTTFNIEDLCPGNEYEAYLSYSCGCINFGNGGGEIEVFSADGTSIASRINIHDCTALFPMSIHELCFRFRSPMSQKLPPQSRQKFRRKFHP